MLLLLASTWATGVAFGGGNDDAAEALVQASLKAQLDSPASVARTLARLEVARRICERGCGGKTKARVLVAIGTIHALEKRPTDAKQAFAAALKEDPEAAPFPEKTNPEIAKLFEEVKAPAPPTPGPLPSADKGSKACKSEVKAPADWKSGVAFCHFAEAVAAEAAQDWKECIDNADASLAAEERPTTRYLGAQCRERGGKWTDALREYGVVVEAARAAGLKNTATEAQARAKLLRERVPRLVLRPPAGAENLAVTLDGEAVPAAKLGGEMWVDPGSHRITATGKIAGADLRFDRTVTVAESRVTTVDVALGGGGENPMQDPVIAKCMLEAKSKEAFEACLTKKNEGSGLTFRFGSEISGYHDSDAVDVLTPGVSASVESVSGGWAVAGSFLVDIVTAASADIVSMASPRWTEDRLVPALSARKTFGDTQVSIKGNLSLEPDYLAMTTGAALSMDFDQKTVTPSIGYDFGYELSGRSGTSFDVYSLPITVHALTIGSTFVIDKSSIFVPAITSVLLFGDTSKPYRYLPMFAPNVGVLPGETVDSVNRLRLPVRADEEVPQNRKRLALSGTYARRFETTTFRIEERLYIDSWGLKATTTDIKLPTDLSSRFRIWPHVRAHAQTGVDFWQLAYRAEPTPAGIKLPLLRTGDRELGPLLTGTAGGGVRVGIDDSNMWGLTVSADAMYTRFLDHLFVRGRFAFFGATQLDVELD